MKKILSLILTLMMLISVLSIMPVSAEDDETEILGPGVDNNAPSDDENSTSLLGDADGNGKVNVKDATLIQKSVAGIVTLDDESAILSDADRSGAVNVKDATIIQKYVAGLLGKYSSVGEPFDVNPETYRYYFYMPEQWYNKYTAKTGNTAGIYWWEGTNACDSWPGIPAKKGDVEGVYYYDVPKDVEVIIWNNFVDGGSDIYEEKYYYAIQTCNIGSEYYEPYESDLYPEGTDNFDNMIYIVDFEITTPYSSCYGKHQFGGMWYYYYGNGEYGTAKVRGESEILTERGTNISDKCGVCGSSFVNPTIPERPPVEPEPEKPHPGTNRYYFYMPEDWLNESTETTGNTAGIYWWEGTDAHDGWPGVPARKGDVEGVYYYDVPKDVTTIIWNNYFDGGADPSAPYYNDQMKTCNIGTEFYFPEESDFYPDGTDSFDGMIYVIDPDLFIWGDFSHRADGCGEWFYYYGNGEYGTAKVRGESKILTGDTVDTESLLKDNEPEKVTETYRYYFYMPSHWLNESTETTGDTAGIYWSEGTDAQDKFPGVKAHKTDIEGIYYYDVPADVEKIIWNNYFDGGDDKKAPYCTDEIKTVELDTPDYRLDENKQYPEDAVVAESMIFITDLSNYNQDYYTKKITYIGEWFYYYGNGEYGASEVRGEDYILTEPTINRVPPSM